jgi:hypothetical protein
MFINFLLWMPDNGRNGITQYAPTEFHYVGVQCITHSVLEIHKYYFQLTPNIHFTRCC